MCPPLFRALSVFQLIQSDHRSKWSHSQLPLAAGKAGKQLASSASIVEATKKEHLEMCMSVT